MTLTMQLLQSRVRIKQKFKQAFFSLLWRFLLRRKYSGCVTEDGQAFVIGAAQFVLGPGRQDLRYRIVDAFASIERVLVAMALMDLTRMILSRGTPQL